MDLLDDARYSFVFYLESLTSGIEFHFFVNQFNSVIIRLTGFDQRESN